MQHQHIPINLLKIELLMQRLRGLSPRELSEENLLERLAQEHLRVEAMLRQLGFEAPRQPTVAGSSVWCAFGLGRPVAAEGQQKSQDAARN